MLTDSLMSLFQEPYIDEPFFSGDTEEKFKRNRKALPSDWIYHTKPIRYKHNSQGFRTQELNDVYWPDSIVMFGCSLTYGEGLAEEDTVAKQLEAILDIPVINLGVCGSAVDLNCWNSTILRKNYPVPKSIVHCWTNVDRYTFLQDSGEGISLHPMDDHYYRNRRFNAQAYWHNRSKFYIETDRLMWKSVTAYAECTWFQRTTQLVPDIPMVEKVDRARDVEASRDEGPSGHTGINTARNAAELLAEQLKAQL